ncbi:MAG: DUF6538 domain-containing protein, partial [Paracoccaceae bacterium]
MAGQTRNLKVKGGRFYARIPVPSALRAAVGKSELSAPLGADRREALKALPEAVAILLRQLASVQPQVRVTKDNPIHSRQRLSTEGYGDLGFGKGADRAQASSRVRYGPLPARPGRPAVPCRPRGGRRAVRWRG